MVQSRTVATLRVALQATTKGFSASLNRAETQVSKLNQRIKQGASGFGTLRRGIFNVQNALGAFIGGVLVRGVFQIAQAGANLDQLEQSFNRLTAEAGLSSREILGSLRELSAGTISNADLIVSANRAMVLGVAESTEDFTGLMELARLRARDLGLTTTQAFNDIVTGIGRGSALILDNIGVIVSQTDAEEKYAQSLGITRQELTKNQRAEAIKFAVLEEGRKQIEQVGELNLTYSERLQQVTASLTNLKDNIGRALLPALVSLLGATEDSGVAFLQTRQEVNELGRTFYRIGQGVIAFGQLVKTVSNFVVLSFNRLAAIFFKAHRALDSFGLALNEFIGNERMAQSFRDSIQSIDELSDALGGKLIEDAEQATEASQKFLDAIREVGNPQNYEGLSDNQFRGLVNQNITEPIEQSGESAEDAQKRIEGFQEQLLSTVDSAREAQQALGRDLSNAFTSFGNSITDNVRDTTEGLAQIVVNAQDTIADLEERRRNSEEEAEQRIADLRERRRNSENSRTRRQLRERISRQEQADTKERQRIDDEIKAQQAIVSGYTEFQEREAERVEALRTRLEEAGIDASRAGLDNLLEVRDLEAEVQEQRRLADLNEFQRFEEQQIAKREALVTAFIEEVNLINEKTETQRQLEQETTDFLLEQNNLREESVAQFADSAIAKYGEMAQSLRQAVTLQERLNTLRTGRNVTASDTSSGSVTNDNSRQVNATINVNAEVSEEVDIDAIGQGLAQQLKTL